MDILDALRQIDQKLFDWILDTTPTNDDERAQMKQVVHLRSQISDQIDMLTLQQVKLSMPALQGQMNQLADITSSILGTAHQIDTVKQVIGYASSAVGIAAQVAGIVAAA
jgi:hypothetical protein